MTGVKFLFLQLLDEEGQPTVGYEVAADHVGAGLNEWVLVSRGSAARQVAGSEKRPVDAVVVGIIDTVSVDNRPLYNKRDHDR